MRGKGKRRNKKVSDRENPITIGMEVSVVKDCFLVQGCEPVRTKNL
jgi:hypothetical protein